MTDESNTEVSDLDTWLVISNYFEIIKYVPSLKKPLT